MSSINKLITSRRNPGEEFMDLPQLWFREIRPSLGEDQKLSKYAIIGKICLTGLRETPSTAHRMMIKIFRDCESLECCMVHPTRSLAWPKIISGRRYQSSKSSSQPYLHCSRKMPAKERESAMERERSSKRWQWSWWIHLVGLYPLCISFSKFEGKMKSPWWPRVWRELVWETSWKCPQGGVPLMIKFIRWYGPVHCWNGYLAMLFFFLMVIR